VCTRSEVQQAARGVRFIFSKIQDLILKCLQVRASYLANEHGRRSYWRPGKTQAFVRMAGQVTLYETLAICLEGGFIITCLENSNYPSHNHAFPKESIRGIIACSTSQVALICCRRTAMHSTDSPSTQSRAFFSSFDVFIQHSVSPELYRSLVRQISIEFVSNTASAPNRSYHMSL